MAKLLGTVLNTYCPLCGSMHLSATEWKNQVWVYCPVKSTGPGDAHTAFPIKRYRPQRDDVEIVAPADPAADQKIPAEPAGE